MSYNHDNKTYSIFKQDSLLVERSLIVDHNNNDRRSIERQPFNGRTGSIKIIFCFIMFYFVPNVTVNYAIFDLEKKKYQKYLIDYDNSHDRSLSNNKKRHLLYI